MSRAQRGDGPVIDIHCHRECAVAADFMKEAQAAAGKVPLGHGNATTRAVNERQLATIKPKMDELEVRLADMDAMGIDVQAISVAPPQYYYWTDVELGRTLARMQNENLASIVADHPDRFVGLATVPLQDVSSAVEELEHCVREYGFRGVEINTNVFGLDLDDRRFRRFFAKAEGLRGLRPPPPHRLPPRGGPPQ